MVELEQATICLPYSLKNGALIWAMFRCLVRGGIRTGHSLSHSLQDEHGLANSSEPREGAILLTCEAFSFFFLFLCCPIIHAIFRGIALLVLIMASLPPARPKTHSTLVALPPKVHRRCQIIIGMWGTLFELKILPRCCELQNSSTKTKPLHWHGFFYVLLPFTAKLKYFNCKVASFLQH